MERASGSKRLRVLLLALCVAGAYRIDLCPGCMLLVASRLSNRQEGELREGKGQNIHAANMQQAGSGGRS